MLKTYKYRIYPNSEQKEYLAKTFGCTRFVYNKMLNDIKVKYNIGKVIVEAQGWKYNSNYGNKLIKEWSKELIEKYGPYFSIENLKNMRTIYLKLDEDYKNSDFLNFDFFILETIIVPDMQENMQ